MALTPKQTRIVKEKVKADLAGIAQQEVAEALYPNQTPGAAAVSMSRELKNANVQEAIQKALVKHGITIDSATQPIADGLQAEQEYYDKNGKSHARPDHSIRLKASGMALKLMGAEQKADSPVGTINFINNASFKSGKYIE